MKGVQIFVGLLLLSIFFCGIFPFVIMPKYEVAMALPVISVPGEKLCKDCVPLIGDFTNTMVGTLIADVLVLLLILPVAASLKQIPGRMQSVVELLVGALDGLATSAAGAEKGRRLFPLAATIFIFLLMANWIELIPGVDSVGLIHCAEEGFNGYPTKEGLLGMTYLMVDENLDPGTRATHADYEACEAAHHGDDHAEEEGDHAEEEGSTAAEGEGEEHAEDEESTAVFSSSEEGDGGEGDHAAEEGEAHGASEASADLWVVTPFIRAAATDLNLTIALALIAFTMVQYYGWQELKLMYVAKFINTPALEQGGMGYMMFGISLLEIVSELSKILSWAFRLFGNIFAGQVLLFVIPFLVATMLPGAIYGLELFVGLIQAFVFAMLFLTFASMAMTSHHDEEHH